MTERLSLSDVHALAQDSLARSGAPDRVARAVAAEVAAAEAAGERHHGMEALLRDLRLMRYGRIDATATTVESHPRPGLILCDACHGFAAAVLAGAGDTLADLARRNGIALLRLDRSSDPGAMIRATALLAEGGLAALAFGASGPGRVAHPDMATPALLRHPPRDVLAMLMPRDDTQPADSPLGGPVDHGAWIIAFDTIRAETAPFDARIWDTAPPPPSAAHDIALSAELLEQIVTA